MSKSSKAFRTIGEVAEILHVEQHILRYWEDQIEEIKPIKRNAKSRLYRPADLQLLSGINKLINVDGHSVRAVQKVIKEKGKAFVSELNPINLDIPTPSANIESVTAIAQKYKISNVASFTSDRTENITNKTSNGKLPDNNPKTLISESKRIEQLKGVYSELEDLMLRMQSAVRAL